MDYIHFMKIALDNARKTLYAGEFPVECLLVYQNRIIATGSRICTAGNLVNEIDHAEMIALKRLSVLKEDIDHSKITLFSTMEPCLMCFGAILLSGIGELVYAYEDVMGGGTGCFLTELTPLYKNHQISIVPNILRDESLELFKAYFADPKTTYWKESLLADYTLNQ